MRAGAEVVQVYIAPSKADDTSLVPLEANIGRPEKELGGFEEVHLEPGASQKVTIALDKFEGAFWDEMECCWVGSARGYRVQVGSSTQGIDLGSV